ncbi:methylated-DNA-[protein]-cysteine S-methyltransferase [Marinococcus luteus]|uniref:Methylated-DNA--protein-cysteine methyltransferase n=1 Tax=Marinococcus luteus TaxID=1122204 RepID=A0A1H2SCE1_9BACI|nr:methylated-DNA--[protein]-cysteine S-methyltransferase [Marinococcus luteus]SDW29316.1 methylated-DNA-[protein]-cysteine S-methyltransferase [Marinococcus luteus]
MEAWAASQVFDGIGEVTVVLYEGRVCMLHFGSVEENEDRIKLWLKKHIGASCELRADWHPVHNEVFRELEEYAADERTTFTVPLDMRGTPFQKKVWQALQSIPYGTTKSYAEIAAEADSPKAFRAVGMANNKNPVSIIVPCHRVIGKDGKMVGFGSGIHVKEALLALEKAQAVSR